MKVSVHVKNEMFWSCMTLSSKIEEGIKKIIRSGILIQLMHVIFEQTIYKIPFSDSSYAPKKERAYVKY